MEEKSKQEEGQNEHINKHEHEPLVSITVNSTTYKIHRGHRTVAEIKITADVPLADDLEQVVDGKLIPLSDDGALTIKGHEVFLSHVKDGSSS